MLVLGTSTSRSQESREVVEVFSSQEEMTSTFLIQKFFLNNALQKTIMLIKLFLIKYSWMKFTGEWLWPAEEVVLSGA